MAVLTVPNVVATVVLCVTFVQVIRGILHESSTQRIESLAGAVFSIHVASAILFISIPQGESPVPKTVVVGGVVFFSAAYATLLCYTLYVSRQSQPGASSGFSRVP